jgi:hypothetical protein
LCSALRQQLERRHVRKALPALYLFAYVALRLRVSRTFGRGRLVAAVACALLFPVAVVVPALVALTLVAAVWVALHAYEIIWWHEARARARALRLPASVSRNGGLSLSRPSWATARRASFLLRERL